MNDLVEYRFISKKDGITKHTFSSERELIDFLIWHKFMQVTIDSILKTGESKFWRLDIIPVVFKNLGTTDE